MGFPAVSEPANPTWQQYTGLTYTQAFPSNPIKVNGYYLDYTFNSDSDTVSFPGKPVIPGASLGDFFFGCFRGGFFSSRVLTGHASRSIVAGRGYSRI
jgi:hypothetical protein